MRRVPAAGSFPSEHRKFTTTATTRTRCRGAASPLLPPPAHLGARTRSGPPCRPPPALYSAASRRARRWARPRCGTCLVTEVTARCQWEAAPHRPASRDAGRGATVSRGGAGRSPGWVCEGRGGRGIPASRSGCGVRAEPGAPVSGHTFERCVLVAVGSNKVLTHA